MPRSSLVSQVGFGGILILFCHGFPIGDEQMVLYISPGTVWHNAVVPKQGLTEPEVSLGGMMAWSRLGVAGHETEAEQSGGMQRQGHAEIGAEQRRGHAEMGTCAEMEAEQRQGHAEMGVGIPL